MLKIFLLLYADDIVIFANTPEEFKNGLDILYNYCLKWKLTININKTKVMIFVKGVYYLEILHLPTMKFH